MLVKEAIQSKGSREFLNFLTEAYPVKEKTASLYREVPAKKKTAKKPIPEEYIFIVVFLLAYPSFLAWIKLILWIA